MKWRGREGSINVKDIRGSSGGYSSRGGGFRPGIPTGPGGLIFLLIMFLIFGRGLFSGGSIPDTPSSPPSAPTQSGVPAEREMHRAGEDEVADFVKVVLKDTEDVWQEVFRQYGYEYKEPTLVLYTDFVQSACGLGQAAQGPFYCPRDEQVYIDLSFFQDLKDRFGAPGDFAIAYVLAHEVGHHVQNQLGIMDQYHQQLTRLNERDAKALSVRVELQADYLAGVWARHVQEMGYLEQGDVQEAINAAAAVGDDRIQRHSQGYVVPDSFTHGSAEQRARWFKKGFDAGDLSGWDTFSAQDL